jgi:YidC/Oxa1 family membrane protein insertase
MHNLWNTVLYQPLYNILIFLTNIIPTGDVGVAIIVLTLLVKLVLYPFTKKSIESQAALARMQPELDRIKKEYPNKEEQAKKTMELYKEQNSSPFSGCLVMLVQLPIILALYYVFYHGFSGDNSALLYSFVKAPAHLNTLFLGFLDITKPHIVLAVLAGISQFIQMKISFSGQPKTPAGSGTQADIMKSMQTQMQYVLPIMITFIGLRISGGVALYWITSNIVGAFQEYRIRANIKKVHHHKES